MSKSESSHSSGKRSTEPKMTLIYASAIVAGIAYLILAGVFTAIFNNP